MKKNTGFDLIEYGNAIGEVLLKQAKTASILGHAGSIGSARELFIRHFLQLFLPPTVVVGSGFIVTGHKQQWSRQQDIILYRSNFPVFTTYSGTSLYIAEGVLGTIEVKSTLDKKSIDDARTNIASLRSLNISLYGEILSKVPHFGSDDAGTGLIVYSDTSDSDEEGDLFLHQLQESDDIPIKTDLLLDLPSERIRTYLFCYTEQGGTIDKLEQHLCADGTGLPDCVCVPGEYIAFSEIDDTLKQPIKGKGIVSKETISATGWMLAHLWRGIICRRARIPYLRPYVMRSKHYLREGWMES